MNASEQVREAWAAEDRRHAKANETARRQRPAERAAHATAAGWHAEADRLARNHRAAHNDETRRRNAAELGVARLELSLLRSALAGTTQPQLKETKEALHAVAVRLEAQDAKTKRAARVRAKDQARRAAGVKLHHRGGTR